MTTSNGQIDELQKQLWALKAQVDRLEGDLDESRRLNLRAAELLDIVYDLVGGAGADPTKLAAAGT